jgi:hypothetical protein
MRCYAGKARTAAPMQMQMQMINIIAGAAQRKCQRKSAARSRRRKLGVSASLFQQGVAVKQSTEAWRLGRKEHPAHAIA